MKQAGFTLVEVIVVIVIIAILAAIGVPALTGYIDKAQDKKWEVRAHDISLAVRSALNEDYALGNINNDYVNARGNPVFNNTDVWASQLLVSGGSDPRAAAAGLIAEVYPGIDDPNVWGYNIVGPPGSTPWEADGFYIDIFPEGATGWVGKPMIIITFKMSHLDFEPADSRSALDDAMHDANYDPNAGFYVYHVIGDE